MEDNIMKTQAKWDNGDKLKDKITGFEGVVMVIAHYSTGCIHYGLLSEKLNKDGGMDDWLWLDQSRLDLVEKSVTVFDIDEDSPSGPMPCGHEM
jgi:hypothetical protein